MRTPFPSSDARVNNVIRSWLKFLKEILSKRKLISSSLQSFLSVFCQCSRNLITDITFNSLKYNEFRSTLLYPANSFIATSKEYFASHHSFSLFILSFRDILVLRLLVDVKAQSSESILLTASHDAAE